MLPNYAETTEYGRNRDHHDHRILQAFRMKINFEKNVPHERR